MELNNKTLNKKLETLAWKSSKPFCYGCYKEAPSGVCKSRHSDDLMKLVDGVGVEFGIDWVIKHLVESNLTKYNTEAAFEDSIAQSYSETIKAGWMELDAITVMKTIDPIAWKMAHDEYVDSQVEDEQLVTFDNGYSYYEVSELENFLDKAD